MRWADIPFHPSGRMLRQFACLWLLIIGALAGWQWLVHQREILAAVLAALAVGVGLVGIFRPRAIRPLFVGCMVLTFPIGWTVSRLILAVVYFGLFTPLAIVFRLIGRDPLLLRRQTERETYWNPKPGTSDPRRYLRQY